MTEFIQIPKTLVELPDGSRCSVASFRIARRCVTVHEFQLFEEETGYRTAAQQSGRRSFMENEMINHLAEAERMESPAFCVSYYDAKAYCDWCSVLVPTELQWLAAGIIDSQIYRRRRDCPLCDARGRILKAKLPNCIELVCGEWTSTKKGNGMIVRRGPFYFREATWRDDEVDNREIRAPDAEDLMISFRVSQP